MEGDIYEEQDTDRNISQKSICLFIPIFVTSVLAGKPNPYALVNRVLNGVE